jgi:tRNA modification GTPase
MPWGDWIQNTCEDPIAAAATRALAEATTQRTAMILLDQVQGALRTALKTIRQSLRQDDLASAQTGLDGLLASAFLGLHLVSGWQVVLAGRSNVGKSSLINALLGYERAIVFDQPGTTRDTLAASTALQGWPVALIDTAGLRKTADPLESAGMQAATAVLEEADLVLLIFDVSLPWTAEDDEWLERFPDALLVHNKCDLTGSLRGARPAGLESSAVEEGGVVNLCEQIIRRLVGQPPPARAAVPFTHEQVDLLEQARAAVAGDDAAVALGLISGLPFFAPRLATEDQ